MMRALIVVIGLLAPSVAPAYVPTQTCTDAGPFACQDGETPKQVRWKSRCVSYFANETGSSDIDDGQVSESTLAAIRTSFDTWTNVACSDLTFMYGGTTDEERAEYIADRGTSGNANVVVWRDEDWPYASRSAFAITSVTFNPDSGLIVDADIEFNGEAHDFTVGDINVEIDVQNTLTHEVGHFLGLDHTPDDEATMFASAGVGEVQKRTLESDDVAGICAIYPVVDADRVCATPTPFFRPDDVVEDDGCCATVPRQTETPFFALLLVASALVLRRKRFG